MDIHLKDPFEAIVQADAKYADPGKILKYGTAGFRDKAEKLERCFFRCGLVVGMRAKKLGATMGVMVTASHNPAPDNGIKIVEPNGCMLAPTWEPIAE